MATIALSSWRSRLIWSVRILKICFVVPMSWVTNTYIHSQKNLGLVGILLIHMISSKLEWIWCNCISVNKPLFIFWMNCYFLHKMLTSVTELLMHSKKNESLVLDALQQAKINKKTIRVFMNYWGGKRNEIAEHNNALLEYQFFVHYLNCKRSITYTFPEIHSCDLFLGKA